MYTMFLFIKVLVIVPILKQLQPGECLIGKAIFEIKKQKYLASHVIETRQAENELECGMHCLKVGSCASANFKTSGIGKGLCELNNKRLQEVSDDDGSINNEEFTHLYIIEKVRKNIYTLLFLFWLQLLGHNRTSNVAYSTATSPLRQFSPSQRREAPFRA